MAWDKAVLEMRFIPLCQSVFTSHIEDLTLGFCGIVIKM